MRDDVRSLLCKVCPMMSCDSNSSRYLYSDLISFPLERVLHLCKRHDVLLLSYIRGDALPN